MRQLAKLLRSLAGRIDPARYDINESRYDYQQRYRKFSFPDHAKIVDVGCGTDPFPFATTLVDLHAEPTEHRFTRLADMDRDVVIADIQDLPFQDNEFDFVYCCHVLEHVDDPIVACRELMRIGKRGFIETPTLMKDALFGWAKGMHRWHLTSIGNRLCFFEYSPRQLDGIRCNAFEKLIFSRGRSDLQDAYFENIDLFNIMFDWEQDFQISVFYRDGTVQESNSLSQSQASFAGSH